MNIRFSLIPTGGGRVTLKATDLESGRGSSVIVFRRDGTVNLASHINPQLGLELDELRRVVIHVN